jgi:hypothetical protein
MYVIVQECICSGAIDGEGVEEQSAENITCIWTQEQGVEENCVMRSFILCPVLHV